MWILNRLERAGLLRRLADYPLVFQVTAPVTDLVGHDLRARRRRVIEYDSCQVTRREFLSGLATLARNVHPRTGEQNRRVPRLGLGRYGLICGIWRDSSTKTTRRQRRYTLV